MGGRTQIKHPSLLYFLKVKVFGDDVTPSRFDSLVVHPQFLFHKRILGISFYGIEEIDPSGRWVLNQTPTVSILIHIIIGGDTTMRFRVFLITSPISYFLP